MLKPNIEPVKVNGAPVEYDECPENCRDTLQRYIEYGIPCGSFLTAFLGNDLMGALGRADYINIGQFKEIGMFLYNFAPGSCYGSPEKVRDYMTDRQAIALED